MQISALQLEHYFVTDITFTANKKFNFKKRLELKVEHLSAVPAFMKDERKADHWQVSLKLKYQPSPEVNVPYHFALEMTGFFQVHKKCEPEMKDRLIKINAPSLLYGAAREFIRSLMSNGPYPALLLPAVSFMPEKMVAKASKATETKAAAVDAKAASAQPI